MTAGPNASNKAKVMEPKIKVKDVIKNLELGDLGINTFIRIKIGE